jgi:RIO-like serine/threonine protein kinase
MKLDVNALRYLSREDFRVLTAVEMGQKNVSCAHACIANAGLHAPACLQTEPLRMLALQC